MDILTTILRNGNISCLKEPRGFIKILQIVLAIFAFATTTNHRSHFTFQVQCPNNPKILKGIFSYPYKLNHFAINRPLCGGVSGQQRANALQDAYVGTHPLLVGQEESYIYLEGDYSSAAQFYVGVGVLAFLYATGALIVYMFFDRLYEENERYPRIDFIVTLTFALLWFIASCAWAKNLNDLKYYTNPDHIIARFPECKIGGPNQPPACITKFRGDFSSLNVSIIFGFANLILWGGNVWFLYKETNWFKLKAGAGTGIGGPHSGMGTFSAKSPVVGSSAGFGVGGGAYPSGQMGAPTNNMNSPPPAFTTPGMRPPPPLFNRT